MLWCDSQGKNNALKGLLAVAVSHEAKAPALDPVYMRKIFKGGGVIKNYIYFCINYSVFLLLWLNTENTKFFSG